jgi:transposase
MGSPSQLEEELGIGHGNLSRWKREMVEEGEQAFPGKGHLTLDEERLRQERDILKKVVEIFSRSRE